MFFTVKGPSGYYNSTALPSWNNLPIVGGGFCIKLAAHSSGALLTGVDVFGGYVGSTVTGTPWISLATQNSVPSAYLGSPYLNGGAYDICFDPSNAQNMLFFYSVLSGGNLSTVWYTTNGGQNWSLCNFGFTADDSNSSDGTRFNGQHMAIDPNNSNIAYVGNGTGLYVTTNLALSGTSWTQVSTSSVPAPTTAAGICGVVFDTTQGTTSGATNRILVGVNGHGIYQTLNAGSSWTLISGSPTSIGCGYIGSDGTYYCTASQGAGTLTRITSALAVSSWSVGNDFQAFALDPANPARGIGMIPEGGPVVFSAAVNTGTPTATQNTSSATLTSTDAPWMSISGSSELAISNIVWDPLVTTSNTSLTIGTGTKSLTVGTGQNIAIGDILRCSNTGTFTNYMLGSVTSYNTSSGALTLNVGSVTSGGYLGAATGGSGTLTSWTITKERIWAAAGIGVFYMDTFPSSTAPHWISQTAGIENLVANNVIWYPGANPLLTSADRPWWPVPSNPLSSNIGLPGYGPNYSSLIVEGNFVDSCASSPSTVIGATSEVLVSGSTFAGISTSGGAVGTATNSNTTSWTSFGTAPATKGFVAMSTSTNFVIAPIGTGTANYTTNGGSSWASCSGLVELAGNQSFFGNALPLCADEVTAGTFYAYGDNSQFYVSTDAGATWTSKLTISSNTFLVKLKPVHGNAGVLFFTAGAQNDEGTTTSLASVISSHPVVQPFYLLQWNGSTLTQTSIPNVAEVIDFGFCAPKPGGNGFPSIFILGWVSGVYGCYRADNFNIANVSSTVWVNVGLPLKNSMDCPKCIQGDPNNWDWAIAGFEGSSFAFRGNSGIWP